VSEFTALEAIALSRSSSLRGSLAVGAVSGKVAELTTTEAVSASGTLGALNRSVGAVSSEMTRLTASVAVVGSGTLASTLSTEARRALGAVSGEVVGFTAVEAVSTLGTSSSGDSLGLVGAVTSHVSLTSTGEATVLSTVHSSID
jgi:hypothetical protein